MDRGAWQVQSMGSQRVGHDWSDLADKQLAGISSEEVCLHVTQNPRWQRPKYERSLLLFFMSRQHRDSITALWSWGLTLSIWFSKQHQHPASTSVQGGYFSSSCSQTPGRSKRKKTGITLSITMSITLRTNLRRWAHCLSSLPIGQHMVTWLHQTAEDAGKCSLSSREECVQFGSHTPRWLPMIFNSWYWWSCEGFSYIQSGFMCVTHRYTIEVTLCATKTGA